jgi:hypothetical protein
VHIRQHSMDQGILRPPFVGYVVSAHLPWETARAATPDVAGGAAQ